MISGQMSLVICQKCAMQHQVGANWPAVGKPFKCTGCGATFMAKAVSGDATEADLPVPKRQTPDFADLPAPKRSVGDITDLPAPKRTQMGGMHAGDLPDLLAPAPARSQQANIPDLLAPVHSRADIPDLLAPVPSRAGAPGIPDLLAPVGPTSRGAAPGIPDLLAPVGPNPRPGLPTPVGPGGGIPDLLAPVGPMSRGSDLMTPKGGTGGTDFLPPLAGPGGGGMPRSTMLGGSGLAGGMPMAPPMAPHGTDADDIHQLDDADVMESPPTGMGPSLSINLGSFGNAPSVADTPPPSLEDDYDAPPAPTNLDNVLSFGAPSAAAVAAAEAASVSAPAAPSGEAMLDVADGRGAAVARANDLGRAVEAKAKVKQPLSPSELRKRKIIGGIAAGVLAIGGVSAFFVMRARAAEARRQQIARGIEETKKALTLDAPGHWGAAQTSAERTLKLAPNSADALGLEAQAVLGAVYDEGLDAKAKLDKADQIMNRASREGADGDELDKATSLRGVIDGKPTEAIKQLSSLVQKERADPNLFLYLGWAELEARHPVQAKDHLTKALALTPGRTPAVYAMARAHLMAGNKEEAKKAFEAVLAKTPAHVGARLGMVELEKHEKTGKKEKGLAEILASPEARTAHPRVLARAYTLYGDEALSFGRVTDASERYLEALRQDPRSDRALIGQALVMLEQGKLTEARARLQAVLGRSEPDARTLVALARISLAEGRITDAHDSIDKAVALGGDDPEVQVQLGRVLEADPVGAGVKGAEAAYRKAIEIDPERYVAHISLSRLLALQGRGEEALQTLSPVEKAAETDALLGNMLGLAYLAAGDATKAETWFRRAVGTDPRLVDARGNLGAALEGQGNLPGAIVEYESAYKMANTREDIVLKLASAYEKAKRPEDAARLFKDLLKPRESGKQASLAARASAGRFYARRGDATQAATLGESILAEDPRYAAGLFLRGIGLLSEGKAIEAQRAFLEATQIDPQSQYFEALGRSYEKQKALEDALAAFETAVKRDPHFVEPRVGRARIHMVRRNFNEAVKELTEAERLAPTDAEIEARLGESFYGLHEPQKAGQHLQKAVGLDPNYTRAYYFLGQVAYDADQPGAVVAALVRFTSKVEPDDELLPHALYTLGHAYRATRRTAEMCATFRTYLERAPRTASQRDEAERLLLPCR